MPHFVKKVSLSDIIHQCITLQIPRWFEFFCWKSQNYNGLNTGLIAMITMPTDLPASLLSRCDSQRGLVCLKLSHLKYIYSKISESRLFKIFSHIYIYIYNIICMSLYVIKGALWKWVKLLINTEVSNMSSSSALFFFSYVIYKCALMFLIAHCLESHNLCYLLLFTFSFSSPYNNKHRRTSRYIY